MRRCRCCLEQNRLAQGSRLIWTIHLSGCNRSVSVKRFGIGKKPHGKETRKVGFARRELRLAKDMGFYSYSEFATSVSPPASYHDDRWVKCLPFAFEPKSSPVHFTLLQIGGNSSNCPLLSPLTCDRSTSTPSSGSGARYIPQLWRNRLGYKLKPRP